MRLLWSVTAILLIVNMVACKSDPQEQALKAIEKYEQDHKIEGIPSFSRSSTAVLDSLLIMYTDYVNTYREDTLCAQILEKSAAIYNQYRDFNRAIISYQRIEKDYEGTEAHPFSLFIQGVLYEKELNDKMMAKDRYQKYLELYPYHAYAAAAQQNMLIMDLDINKLGSQFNQRADSLGLDSMVQ